MKGGMPVVFIHGLWLHSSSWLPWETIFRTNGYETHAPGWPGEGATVAETRMHPEKMRGVGIDTVVEHYANIISSLPEKPILIGHSFGGLVVQKLLGKGFGRAGIALDPAPIQGVLILSIASLKSALPVLRNPFNYKGAYSLTLQDWHYSFANMLTPEESEMLYEKFTIPSPCRPLFEAAAANFMPSSPAKVDTRCASRGPLLITAGGKDQTVPASISHATAKLYRLSTRVTELKEFSDRGHSLVFDHGWREVAEYSLAWLEKQLML